MLESKIIEHCSPTLAGLKSANLFSYEYVSDDILREELLDANQKLNQKGVYIELLRMGSARALLYVYRKNRLAQEMEKPGVSEFLQECGCENCNGEFCIEYLKRRLGQKEEFPHEIGLFLGYPLEDVVGFIRYKGKNCKCHGVWKVYCNEEETMKLFEKFRKCTAVYTRQFAEGKSMVQLTIAA
jgi:hypothetical protein